MKKMLFALTLPFLGGCCFNSLISLLPFFLRPDFKAEIERTDPESMPKVFTPFCGLQHFH